MRVPPLPCARPLCWLMLWISLSFFSLLHVSGTAYASKATFTLQSARGRVEIRASGKGAWKNIGRGSRAASVGDHIRTGADGSVRIVTEDGARVALGPNTEVVLREKDKPRGLRVVLGRVWASITGARSLEARAPGAIAAAEGTTFQLDVAEDGTTVLTVVEGKVRFFNDLGSVTVLGSQQSTAQLGAPPTRPIVVDPSSLTAWEATLQTLIVTLEYPLVSTDPKQLDRELDRREQLAKADPDDAAAQASLAELLLDLQRVEEAMACAQRAVELAPDRGAARGVLGHALLRDGHPAEASEQFALASAAEPSEARWQLGLALVALGQRDAEPAVELLRRAAQLAPDDPLPHAYLTAAYLRVGDLERAAASASVAIALGPDSALANSYLAYLHLAQGKPDEAINDAGRAVRGAPNSALAHEALGTALMLAGQFPEAGLELDRAIELNPTSASAHLARAKLLAAQGEIELALQEAQVSVGLNPQSAPARSALGMLFLLNKDPQRAGRQFQEALAVDPSLSEARTGWGRVLLKRGRFQDAMEQQKLAVSLDTDSASAHNNLGGVHASLGDMEQAIEHLERAIQLQPGWGLPYANLAVVHLEQNRFRQALDAAERAVALGERSPFVHTVLARIYMSQGRSDRALVELRQAVALDDSYSQARFQLAKLYLTQGRSRDAVRDILAAVTVDPSAMVETRHYARTENTAAVGSYSRASYDGQHSGQSADGNLSYFTGWLFDDGDGYREVNQDSSEKFLEVIAGHQSQPDRQVALFGTFLQSDGGLPGPETLGSLGDLDDQQEFTGYDAVLAYRERLSAAVTSTLKYSFRRSHYRFRNPDSMASDDRNPFRKLTNESSRHSPEFRLDADLNDRSTLSVGYARAWDRTRNRGIASVFDPGTGEFVPLAFGTRSTVLTDTAWLEVGSHLSDRFHLTLGEYWGRGTGTSSVLSPKVAAVYRPDRSTWWSLVVTPIFRSDASELAPVEALADPKGLRHLGFAGDGVGHSYELRYQRQGNRASTITSSLAYQEVENLLIDTEDPAASGLPSRLLLDRGHKWVFDAAYEQWLSDCITGRLWARWQSSEGHFPELQVTGTEWPYSPKRQAGGRLDYISSSGLRIGLEAASVGSRYHDPENTASVDGYLLLNLLIRYQQNLHREYFVTVTNLTGRDYEMFAGFPQPERAVLVGLKYRF